MSTITTTVRIVPCRDCNGRGTRPGDDEETIRAWGDEYPGEPERSCDGCDGRGQVVATSERLLVGLVLRWDVFR